MIDAPTLATVKDALGVANSADDARITRHIEAATALANRQAPDAPEAVGHEAIIRAVGWLFEYPDVGGTDAGLFRRCGAAGLLSPWTVRRGGAI